MVLGSKIQILKLYSIKSKYSQVLGCNLQFSGGLAYFSYPMVSWDRDMTRLLLGCTDTTHVMSRFPPKKWINYIEAKLHDNLLQQ